MPPHPATMITTVFVSESPAISHVVDLHAQEKQLPLEQLSCSKGKNVGKMCHNLVFFAETGQFRRVFFGSTG